jgi:GNAT superfamily N-acetyltransferase
MLLGKFIFFPILDSYMSSLVIRVATIRDISGIVKIRLKTLTDEEISGFSAPEFATTSSNEKLLKLWDKGNRLKDGFEVFLAEDEGRLLGYMMFKLEGDSGYIDDIVVAKEEQGKGVGRALVTYAEGVAKSQKCYLMKTDTTENANGIPWRSYNFWLRMGYQDTGERIPTDYDFKEIPFIKKLQ